MQCWCNGLLQSDSTYKIVCRDFIFIQMYISFTISKIIRISTYFNILTNFKFLQVKIIYEGNYLLILCFCVANTKI